MKNSNIIIAGAAIAACSLSAQAAEPKTKASLFSYNYLQATYVDMDGGLDGLAFGGSLDIADNLAINASYMTTDDSGTDYDLLSIGANYHFKFDQLENADLALHGEYVDADIDRRNANRDDDGLRFGALLRYQVQPNLEVFGDISYTTLFDNDMTLTPGIVLHFTPQVAAVVSYEHSDADILQFGVRIEIK